VPTQNYAASERLLRITLCDPSRPEHELDVDFRIFDSPIARRWSDVIVFLAEGNSYLYDPERFYNFPNDTKTSQEWLYGELNRLIADINQFVPGHVDISLSPDMGQEVMNELHERFADGLEDLVDVDAIEALKRDDAPLGAARALIRNPPSWQRFVNAVREHSGLDAEAHSFRKVFASISDHPRLGEVAWQFYSALNPVGAPLEALNKAIHRWEDQCAARLHEATTGEECWKYIGVNFFPFACIRMRDEDFKHFTIEDRFGRVYLDDMTAGKCIWDVYRDRDEHVVDEHYKSLGYYWGDMRIYFGRSHTAELTGQRLEKFWEWFGENEALLAARGFKRDDPRMTIGSVPVADFEPRGVLAGLDAAAVVRTIGDYQRVKSVCIVNDQGERVRESGFSTRFQRWDSVLTTFGETATSAGDYAG
jgi:hypothetical protein